VHWVLLTVLGLGGCGESSVRHPLVGHLRPVRTEPGYWIYVDDGWLHLRITSGEHGHRFQGSVTAVGGALGPLELERPAMSEQVAAQGQSIQFDLEPGRGVEEGFRVRLDRACARFDLYVDGAHRPERVRLGPHRLSPRGVPFERCP
jgi:hypothetical protein